LRGRRACAGGQSRLSEAVISISAHRKLPPAVQFGSHASEFCLGRVDGNGTCNKASVTSAKWKDPYANISVIRLSEMYLIRAECNARLNSSVGDTPVNDVNAIRSKAGASAYGAVTLNDILLERDLELAFEGQRIHDYKRTGKQIAGVDNQGNPITIKYTDPQFIFPVPQTEINTNKNLAQNSYYH